ncbi:hypothetical protein F5Y09DRAFT_191177 [Xylaria sp. FL1042]|nr:hypothetical protein F5Y09DRAFT_191177 [Xylaria sp. FL1042]
MCPRRLIDSVSESSSSDDDFDRHGRIRRQPWYSDSEDGDYSGSTQLLDSRAETNDNTEQPSYDPGQTSLANGGGVQELDDQASQTSPPIRSQERERGANAGRSHPIPS